MTEPTVTVVYDADGREHHTSSSSQFLRDGLATGELTTEPPSDPGDGKQEESSGDSAPPQGDDQNTGRRNRRGPVDGKPEDATADGGA